MVDHRAAPSAPACLYPGGGTGRGAARSDRRGGERMRDENRDWAATRRRGGARGDGGELSGPGCREGGPGDGEALPRPAPDRPAGTRTRRLRTNVLHRPAVVKRVPPRQRCGRAVGFGLEWRRATGQQNREASV